MVVVSETAEDNDTKGGRMMDDGSKSGIARKTLIKAAKIIFSTLLGAGMLFTISISASCFKMIPFEKGKVDVTERFYYVGESTASDIDHPIYIPVGTDSDVARGLCLSEEYDSAIEMYERMLETNPGSKETLVNLGYAYSHRDSDDERYEYTEKAIDCYERADCVQGERNLLMLCLRYYRGKDAEKALRYLLKRQDRITLSYLKKSLVDTGVMTREDLTTENASVMIAELSKVVFSGLYYVSYDVPDDTRERHYEYVHPDWNEYEDGSEYQQILKVYLRRFTPYSNKLEYIYYTVNGTMNPVVRYTV